MKDSHANLLRAFLAVLIQRTDPLSAEAQQQLHNIGELLSANPNEIPLLETLAYRHADLKAAFNQMMLLQEIVAGERNKGLDDLPDQASPALQQFSTELENSASSTSHLQASRDLLNQLQAVSEPILWQQAIQTFLAIDPVEVAKDMMIPQSPI